MSFVNEKIPVCAINPTRTWRSAWPTLFSEIFDEERWISKGIAAFISLLWNLARCMLLSSMRHVWICASVCARNITMENPGGRVTIQTKQKNMVLQSRTKHGCCMRVLTLTMSVEGCGYQYLAALHLEDKVCFWYTFCLRDKEGIPDCVLQLLESRCSFRSLKCLKPCHTVIWRALLNQRLKIKSSVQQDE